MALVHDSIPDSEICKKTMQLVTEVSPTSLCNHCIRTFLSSDLLGIRDGLKCDRKLLYLSAITHDLELTEQFDAQQRFGDRDLNIPAEVHAFMANRASSNETVAVKRLRVHHYRSQLPS